MKNTARIILIGAGGHARVLTDIITCMKTEKQSLAKQNLKLVGYTDSNPDLKGEHFDSIPILGPDQELTKIQDEHNITHFTIAIGLTKGGQTLREKLYAMAISAGLAPISLIHPTACIANNVSIGPGSVIMAGVIINSHTHVGANAIINTGAILEHDVRIADHTHIAPRATILGDCIIGNTCMVGAGAVIVPGTRVNDGATIGAGATVLTDVAQKNIVGGTPAKSLKPS